MNIAVLASGGVDSSVAVHLLKEQGYEPTLFYIKIGMEDEHGYIDCPAEDDMTIVTWLGKHYGLKVEMVSLHEEYWDNVVAYTIEKVRQGLTPNPDMMCNKMIKFGYFDSKWGHEFDKIATGHYATTTEIDGRIYLSTSPDPVKDQTDFLSQMSGSQVARSMFPIGHMMKDEVRRIATEAHLPSATRKDSQGICFLGKINYNDYIERYLGDNPGDVIELETGRRIGRHKGLWFHTIGQRKGLGFGGGPWFVVKKDVTNNILYVSHGYDPQTAYKQDFAVCDFHFLTERSLPEVITFKIRHTPEWHEATVEPTGDNSYIIHSRAKIHGVAPGQFCVVYDSEHHRCYGSGEITVE